MIPDANYLDPEGAARIEAEISRLEGELDQVRKDKSDVDHRMVDNETLLNPELIALEHKEEACKNDISYLRSILMHSIIVDVKQIPGIVGIGSVVTISINDGPDEVVKIVSASPRFLDGEVDPHCPLCKAIMGKAPGFKGSYSVEDTTLTVQIIAVQ